ncbi:MAG: NUDIX hydrolase [Proteobacteria bacterium]|nr:MAG: NUDIX hydrolase [Pseudomonadota bacterium]
MADIRKEKIIQDILVAVDTVAFTVKDSKLLILLVKRKKNANSYPNQWSLPGGIVNEKEDASTKETAIKKLQSKTGIRLEFVEQLKTYSGRERDERGWSISTVYFVLMRFVSELTVGDDVSEIKWVPVDELDDYAPLAFDHSVIIDDAVQRLREKARYSLLPAYCLGKSFTFNEFHEAVEIILRHPVQKKSLYRRIESSDALEETGEMRDTGTKKAALYRTNNKTHGYTFDRNLAGSYL